MVQPTVVLTRVAAADLTWGCERLPENESATAASPFSPAVESGVGLCTAQGLRARGLDMDGSNRARHGR